jgi:hypothetical protein
VGWVYILKDGSLMPKYLGVAVSAIGAMLLFMNVDTTLSMVAALVWISALAYAFLKLYWKGRGY